MKISKNCVELAKHYEGLILTAYPDPYSPLGKKCQGAGIKLQDYAKLSDWKQHSGEPWTIGIGCTGGVKPGDTITEEAAYALFMKKLEQFEKDVNSLLKIAVNQNQFDALVSFAYNCGSDIDADTIAEGLGDSTLLRLVNAGDFAGAAKQFLLWNKSGGVVSRGLTRRRTSEKNLFEGASLKDALIAGSLA